MAKAVIMPKFGFTQETADIIKWLVKPGDFVEQGDPIAEVTTDKVDMEVEAPETGILDGVQCREGDTVPVTAVIAYIRQPDETLSPAELQAAVKDEPGTAPAQEGLSPAALTSPPSSLSPAITPVATRLAQEKGVDISQIAGSGPGGRITRRDVEAYLAGRASPSEGKKRAVPAARRLARELGVSLATVSGSGPRGRIQSADVQATYEASMQAAPPPTSSQEGVAQIIPLTGMRRTIAQRMQASKREAPHITFEADIDVTALEDLRQRANALLRQGQARVSLTAVIVKACAWALRRNPLMNTRLEGENILVLSPINIGVAVALKTGLIVPVVHHADQKGIYELAEEIAELAARAREGKLRSQDVRDGTFTISNLGMFGVDRFAAIINPPETGILAVGRVSKRIVPDAEDRPVVRPFMTITLSADHRVVDGAVAARFLKDLRMVLDAPDMMTL